MTSDVRDRHALVTGASGGLGRVVCMALLREGMNVSAVARRRGALDALREESPGDGLWVLEGDVSDGASTERIFDAAETARGPIDAVVHCVGTWAGGPLIEHSDERVAALIATNFTSTAWVLRAALRRMVPRGRGRVVLIGSLASEKPSAGAAIYGATKAAVAHLVGSAAEETRLTGITVNAVLPGMINTPDNRTAMPDADTARWVDPNALAAAITTLLSDDAAAITGTLVRVPDRL